MRPLIAVSSRLIEDSQQGTSVSVMGVIELYLESLEAAGAAPFVLPRTDSQDVLERVLSKAQGLMIPGGTDVDPKYYNENPHSKTETPETLRDSAEIIALKYALKIGLPYLGICRGSQLLNVVCGGSLIQDIASQCPEISDGHPSGAYKELKHSVKIDPNSRLSKIIGTNDIAVNSLHHQAVKKLGAGLKAVAVAPDGVIEAIEGTGSAFVVGVQWHPEVLWQQVEPKWLKLFQAFVSQAGSFQS